MAARLAAALPEGTPDRELAALAALSTLVGALILARAVDDPALSDRILAAGVDHLSAPGQE
jgi:TetR/AcrR family transcriptional repressor of nem operon